MAGGERRREAEHHGVARGGSSEGVMAPSDPRSEEEEELEVGLSDGEIPAARMPEVLHPHKHTSITSGYVCGIDTCSWTRNLRL